MIGSDMDRIDLTVGVVALLLPVVFISIFKYRIAGSNASAVAVGGIALSVGVVVVGYHLLGSIFGGRSEIDAVWITAGSGLITAVIYGIQYGLPGTAYGDWVPVLTVIATVATVTFLIGSKTRGKPSEGLRYGFLIAGTSGVFSTVLVTYEAITREVVFNALVAISSITIPLLLGVVGAIFGLFGNSFARRRRDIRMPLRE
jgi:hypothetical protein